MTKWQSGQIERSLAAPNKSCCATAIIGKSKTLAPSYNFALGKLVARHSLGAAMSWIATRYPYHIDVHYMWRSLIGIMSSHLLTADQQFQQTLSSSLSKQYKNQWCSWSSRMPQWPGISTWSCQYIRPPDGGEPSLRFSWILQLWTHASDKIPSENAVDRAYRSRFKCL